MLDGPAVAAAAVDSIAAVGGSVAAGQEEQDG